MAPVIDTDLRQRVLDSIAVLLPRVLKRDLGVIPESASLFDELGLSSASTLERLLELEDELDVQINIEDISRDDLDSIGALASFVASPPLTQD